MIKDKELILEYFTKHYPTKDKYVYNEIVYFLGGVIGLVIAILIAMMRNSSVDQRSVYDSYSTSRNKKYRETYDDLVEEIDESSDLKEKEKAKIKAEVQEIDTKRNELKALTEERKKELQSLLKLLDEQMKEGGSSEQKKQYEEIKKLLGSMDSLELEENLKKLQDFINKTDIKVDKDFINKKFNFIYSIFNREKSLFKTLGNLWKKFSINMGSSLGIKGSVVNKINEWAGFLIGKKGNLTVEGLSDKIKNEKIVKMFCSGFTINESKIEIADLKTLNFADENSEKNLICYRTDEKSILINDSNNKIIYISKKDFLEQEKFIKFINEGIINLNEDFIKVTNTSIPIIINTKIDSKLNIQDKLKIKFEIDYLSTSGDVIRNDGYRTLIFYKKNNFSFNILDEEFKKKQLSDFQALIIETFIGGKQDSEKTTFEIDCELVSETPLLQDLNIDEVFKQDIITIFDSGLELSYGSWKTSGDPTTMQVLSKNSLNKPNFFSNSEIVNTSSAGKVQDLITPEESAQRMRINKGLDRPNIIIYTKEECAVILSFEQKIIIIEEDIELEDFKKAILSAEPQSTNAEGSSFYPLDVNTFININLKDKKFTFTPYDKNSTNILTFNDKKEIIIVDDSFDPTGDRGDIIQKVQKAINFTKDDLFEFLMQFPIYTKKEIGPLTLELSEINLNEEILMKIDLDAFLNQQKIVESKSYDALICEKNNLQYIKILKQRASEKFKNIKEKDLKFFYQESDEITQYFTEKYIILPITELKFKSKIAGFGKIVQSFKLNEDIFKAVVEYIKNPPKKQPKNEEEEPADYSDELGELLKGADETDSDESSPEDDNLFDDTLDKRDVLKSILKQIGGENQKNDYVDDGNINFEKIIVDKIMTKEEIIDFFSTLDRQDFLKSKINPNISASSESFNFKNKFNNLQTIFNEIFYREIKVKRYNYFEQTTQAIKMIPLSDKDGIITIKIPSIVNVKDLDKINLSNVFEYDLIKKEMSRISLDKMNLSYLNEINNKIIFVQLKEEKKEEKNEEENEDSNLEDSNIYVGDLKINEISDELINLVSEFFTFNKTNEKISKIITESEEKILKKRKEIRENFLSGKRCRIEIKSFNDPIVFTVKEKGQISSNKFDKKYKNLNNELKNKIKEAIIKTTDKKSPDVKSSEESSTISQSPPVESEIIPENIIKKFDLSAFLNNLELIQNPNGSLLLTKEEDQNFLNFSFGEYDGTIIKMFIEKYSSKKEDFEYIIEEIEKIKPTKIKIPVILETAEISDNNLIIKQTSNNNKVVWGDSIKQAEKTPLSPDGIKVPFSKNEITIGTTDGNYIIIDNGTDIETGINTIIKINKDKNGFTIENKLSQTFLNKNDPIEKDKIYKKANIQIGLFPKGESFSVEIEKAKEKIKLENTQFQIFITQLNKIFEVPVKEEPVEKSTFTKGNFFLSLKNIREDKNVLIGEVNDSNGGIIFRKKKDSDNEFIGTLWITDLNDIKFDELKKLEKYFNISLNDYVLTEEFEIEPYQKGFISDDKLTVAINDNKVEQVKQKGNLKQVFKAEIVNRLRKLLKNTIGVDPKDDDYVEKKKEVYGVYGLSDFFRGKGETVSKAEATITSDIGLLVGKISGKEGSVKISVAVPMDIQLIKRLKNNKSYKLFYYIKREEDYYYIELNEDIFKLLNFIKNSKKFKDSKKIVHTADDIVEKIKEDILLFKKIFSTDPKKWAEKAMSIDEILLGKILKDKLIIKNNKTFLRLPTDASFKPQVSENKNIKKSQISQQIEPASPQNDSYNFRDFDSIIINEVFKKWKR